ncbi:MULTISPECIES: dienelactone hydrolase family protein [unclassified Plantactinospora]|uniref:dienelactone hydrolase family protein n=1 Tax=unclassified Plantactinospora TaxID=2631981 RepID=UPI000D15ED99|nr:MULTISPECIES: dienelactone hydrolase family protein [unclassified Plantactinospora]AVT29938.1 carboxymethylenebutenolidase [Plantactinospora sp. BC1]AVT36448.1 carboxymethylenebutenolidase [Plantactinospora sp. BB1]
MRDGMQAGTVRITGAGGDEIEAYLAQPLDATPHGGVVVIHHMPGYDEPTKEITRRLASYGYAAICPNLYSREAPGASPDDAAATARAAGGVPDDRLVGDVGGAADHLRGLPASNGRVGVIGYCSGGRQAFLAATRLPLDAAVDCYGAFVVGNPPESFPLAVKPLLDQADRLSCPLLGLFGAEDQYPSPAQMDELSRELTRLGKPHEFHTFADAGHGFFAVDRPSYRPLAATEGWQRVRDFFDRHLNA